jgi:N-acetylglucosamine kinase-like BadF-type ATPase
MSDSAQRKLLWGIDGGGTKTTILLAEETADRSIQILSSIRAGSSNVNSRPWDDIHVEISSAMKAALESASLPNRQASALVAAFAGVGSPTVRDLWHEWFTSLQVALKVQIVDDGAPLIAAGLPDGWGIVLIVGTGSAAFGRSPTGQTARAGGWGFLISDEGSGFAIGQAALRTMSETYDRGGERSPIMESISERWSLKAPRDMVDRVYRSPEPRQRIAELAPLVCAAAESGESVASEIVGTAAKELAKLVEIVAIRLGLGSDQIPLALSGGVAVNSALLRDEMLAELASRKLATGPATVVEEPARGCIELARRLSQE